MWNVNQVFDGMTPICVYLKSREFPEDEIDTKMISLLGPIYKMIDAMLYKKGFSMPFLRCVAQPKTTTILREVH